MKIQILLLVFLIFVSFSDVEAQRMTLSGTVSEIIDGNTFVLKTSSANFRVRLQFVDPPESGQQLYEIVKSHLTTLLKDKEVFVKVKSISSGLYTGEVSLGNVDVSMQMLRDGAAWYSVPDADLQQPEERTSYLEFEKQAKEEKRGVWGIANIRPAWELRLEREKVEKQRLDAETEAMVEMSRGAALPRKTKIGMKRLEFMLLCGSHSSDRISSAETSAGISYTFTLFETNERIDKGCFGYFDFDSKGFLTYIGRRN